MPSKKSFLPEDYVRDARERRSGIFALARLEQDMGDAIFRLVLGVLDCQLVGLEHGVLFHGLPEQIRGEFYIVEIHRL